MRVLVGDEAGGLVVGPRVAPKIRASSGAGENATHTTAGCVVGAGPRGKCGDDLVDVGGPAGEGIEEQSPVVELVVDGRRESDAVPGPLEGGVEAGEEAATTGEHGRDAAKVAAEHLPIVECAPAGRAREGVEERADFGVACGWE